MSDVETLLHKLRDLTIDAERGVTALQEKLEDLLKQLRQEYKQGKLSDDIVEEIKSRKAQILEINRKIHEGKLKPEYKPNANNNLTYCPRCDSKALKVSYGKYGKQWRNCSVCGNSNRIDFF